MNLEVEVNVAEFVSKARGTASEGKTVSLNDLNGLNKKLSNPLPDWFVKLYSNFPLAGAEVEFPQNEPEGDFDGFTSIELATLDNIYDEVELAYPGFAIKDLGYFCIGSDNSGSGDPYFTTSMRGDNPPVFQVYHDVSDVGEEIVAQGMEQIAGSLSEFFAKLRIVKL